LALFLARADPRHVEQFGAELDAGGVVAGVVAHAGDGGERHLFRADHVFDTHLGRVAADGARHLVDRAFDRKAGAGPPDTAIRAERRLVGRDRVGAGAVVRDRVRAGQGAPGHIGFLVWTLRPESVRAGIDDDLAIDPEHLALAVGIGGDLVMMVAGMSAGQQILAAVLDPAHGVIEFERQRREDDLFGIKPRLRAKPATDIGRDDPDAALLDPEDLAERDPHRVRRLRRGIDDNLVEPVVAIGQDGAAFHRRAGLPVHAVFAGDGDFRRARRGRDVTALDYPFEIEVVAPAL